MPRTPKPPGNEPGSPESEGSPPRDQVSDGSTPGGPPSDEPSGAPDPPPLLRKTFWLDADVDEALRRQAAQFGIPEDELFRRILREHYGLQDP